jgi:hypothetical protein
MNDQNQMLSPQDLQALKINEAVAREAFAQVERRLVDILETKKLIEQKATSLFTAYVTISLAIFGFGVVVFKDSTLTGKAWAFFVSGGLFVLGASSFIIALKGQSYGSIGSAPSAWMRLGVIDGNDDEPARTLAHLVLRVQERIKPSLASNATKYWWVHVGMFLGIAGALVFALTIWLAFAFSA